MLVVIGVLIFLATPMLVKTKGFGDASGARMFPKFLGLLLSVVGAAIAALEGLQMSKGKGEASEENGGLSMKDALLGEWKVLVLLLLMGAYLVLFTKIGFLFSSFLMATTVLALLGEKKVLNYAIACAVVVLIYLGFTKILMVRLP